MPNRTGRDRRGYHHEEWEPNKTLTTVLGDKPLSPEADRNEDLEKLKPHLEDVLVMLERLKRQRGLSDR